MVEKSDVATHRPEWWSQLYEPMRQFGSRVADFFSPSSEAAAAEAYYEITIELPGVSQDDITIEAHDHKLTVTGEKRAESEESGKNFYFSERVYGRFRRAFQLPADADAEKIAATHKDGVLTIQIAKIAEDESKPKRIEITRG